MFMLCTEGEGRSKSLIVSSESHQGRLRFSLSLSVLYAFVVAMSSFFSTEKERERLEIFG